MSLCRDEFLGKHRERRYAEVNGVRIQSLTELERSSLEAEWATSASDKDYLTTMKRMLVVRCLVDDRGERLFQDNEIDLLADCDADITGRLYGACRAHSGFDKGEVESFVKKSETTQDSD